MPLGPLIIKNVIKGRNRILLLPRGKGIYVGIWWVDSMQLSLSTDYLLTVPSCLYPDVVDVIGVVKELGFVNIPVPVF